MSDGIHVSNLGHPVTEHTAAGADATAAERLRALERQFTGRVFRAEDRRHVVRVEVDGHERIHGVDLSPGWARVVQSQVLGAEVARVYQAARRRAAEAMETAQETAGVPRVLDLGLDALRGLRWPQEIPALADALGRLASETVEVGEIQRGIAAEFDSQGRLVNLRIRSRFAVQTDAGALATAIHSILHAGEEASAVRRVEIARMALDRNPFEEQSTERLEALRSRLDSLRSALA